MKELNLEHAEALSAAKLHMIRISDKSEPARFKEIIEKHIKCLSEVYWWVLHTIYTSGEPVPRIPEPKDTPQTKKGKPDGDKDGPT